MQNKNKKQLTPVVKPILKGDWRGKEALKMAPKRTLSTFLIGLLYIFCSVMAGFDQPVLKIIVSLAIIGIAFYFQLIKGMEAGEKDAAFAEIMYERQQEGRQISDEDRRRCFHPFRGAYATFLGVLPFVILCIVYAFMARRWSYTLGVLPGWMDNMLMHDEMKDALSYYNRVNTFGTVDALRIIARSLSMPFINIAGVFGYDAVLLAERLSPLFVMVAPMGFGVGYSRGHVLRTRINTGIQQGVEKKKNKERKARKKRQRSSTPERLI